MVCIQDFVFRVIYKLNQASLQVGEGAWGINQSFLTLKIDPTRSVREATLSCPKCLKACLRANH